ncbi:MAG TPA: MaoC family dehydratase [Alphaproteobacteria bacterium]|nr:MaoC family dehydratase [Alphaproteobacteria bacterium]
MANPGRRFTVGMTLQEWPTIVTAERQQRYHDAAEVPEGLFGDVTDLSILANDTILATRYLKTEEVDGLHAGQRMQQAEPVRLGEPLTLKGRVAEVRPSSRGRFVTFAFDFVRLDGGVPVRGELVSFRPDRAVRNEGSHDARAADLAGFEPVAEKHLTPERVGGYSFEFPDYRVHFDPAAAASVGLRAPVAQGLMSFTWITEALARDGVPREVAIGASFRRPLFWDDTARVLRRGREIVVVNGDGALCSRGEITHLR